MESSVSFRVLEKIKSAILRTDEKIGQTIRVPINWRRAGVVTFDVTIADIAFFFKVDEAVLLTSLAEELGVLAVEENVELAVAIPVHEAEFAAAAFAGGSGVELQELTVLVGKDAPWGLEAARRTFEKGKVAFVVEHDEVG